MTDDLPARLERSAELEKLIKVTDENTRDILAWFNRLAVDARKAAARIRELEAERNNLAVKHHEQAATAGKLRDLLDECENYIKAQQCGCENRISSFICSRCVMLDKLRGEN